MLHRLMIVCLQWHFRSAITRPEKIQVTNIIDSLNPQQKEAVEETDKPLLVIAGAGSGKTLTVASKIAYLIQRGHRTREHSGLDL